MGTHTWRGRVRKGEELAGKDEGQDERGVKRWEGVSA